MTAESLPSAHAEHINPHILTILCLLVYVASGINKMALYQQSLQRLAARTKANLPMQPYGFLCRYGRPA